MTNKPIIIVGVNVSGCEFFENGQCYKIDARNCEGYIHDEVSSCVENSNCYYKQLARKTEECEDLKRQRDAVLESYHQQAINIDNHFKMCERKRKYRLALEEIKPKLQEIYDTAGSGATTYQERLVNEINEILKKCEVLDDRINK